MAAPTSPSIGGGGTQFPSDLTDGSKSFYTSFSFYDYNRGGSGASLQFAGGSSVILPMPDKINDHPTVDWQQENLWDAASSLTNGLLSGSVSGALAQAEAIAKAGNAGLGYLGGQTINPFLVMLFKAPQFKHFSFTWNLAPRTQDETRDLQDILQTFRKNMMPSAGQKLFGINATLKYPKIVVPQFHPDKYLFQFKPCAINSVQYDYNPGGNPSFFKNTGGPTQVRMTVNLTEIEYWLQEDLR